MENKFSDAEYLTFAGWLKGLLKTNTGTITFTKKDGTERVMKCTLQEAKLPVVEQKETTEVTKTRKENPELLSVYDLESDGWRSFNIRQVKQIAFTLGE